jgi:RNA polymerase sigma-70 factor (ECF subfamily)
MVGDERTASIERALSGDRAAQRALLARLAPVIQARAIRILSRRGGATARDPRQEMMDMVQEVFVALLENDGRILRAWRADGGLSLENFVGLVAERQVCSILRTGRRSPWKEEPTEHDDLEDELGPASRESSVLSRDLLEVVLDRLREELSPRMLGLFYALWVDETPVPVICEQLSMQPNAVHAARSRIAKRARAIAAELAHEASDPAIPTRRAEEEAP